MFNFKIEYLKFLKKYNILKEREIINDFVIPS